MHLNILKNAKISIKLTILYAFMFSFVLLLLNTCILYGIIHYLYNQDRKQVEDIKTVLLQKATSENDVTSLTDPEMVSDVPSKGNIFIRIFREDGKILNASGNFNFIVAFKTPIDKFVHIKEGGNHLLYINDKLKMNEYGNVYFQIVKDLDNEDDFMKILLIYMILADVFGILASILLGYIVSRKMLKPIDYITKTAENISINNLKSRINVNGPEDELSRLGTTFNKMIDRLQDAFSKQAQFVSDASHELKTPIAVIQGYANLLDRWGKDDRAALEKSIYAIKLESANMANLVEGLLFLAKGDSAVLQLEKKEFWLNELINEVVSESKLIAPNHVITSEKNDTTKIFADYKMMKQMLRVFIDNSIKFTPVQGKIDIRAELQHQSVRITVSDNGIGIPEEEIQHIFDRFYRVDKSRSKDTGGTGIGLSIAKWIADMHRGTISVESDEGKGSKFIVILSLVY